MATRKKPVATRKQIAAENFRQIVAFLRGPEMKYTDEQISASLNFVLTEEAPPTRDS